MLSTPLGNPTPRGLEPLLPHGLSPLRNALKSLQDGECHCLQLLGRNLAAQKDAALTQCSPRVAVAGLQALPARLAVPVSAVPAVAVPPVAMRHPRGRAAAAHLHFIYFNAHFLSLLSFLTSNWLSITTAKASASLAPFLKAVLQFLVPVRFSGVLHFFRMLLHSRAPSPGASLVLPCATTQRTGTNSCHVWDALVPTTSIAGSSSSSLIPQCQWHSQGSRTPQPHHGELL